MQENARLGMRVLILAPTTRDAQITRDLLLHAGLTCDICESMACLIEDIGNGAGAVILTEEAISAPGMDGLLALLYCQPPWSELPVVMLMRGGGESPVARRVLHSLRNVTLLERPAAMRTLESAVRVAVHSRQRQYQIRDQMEAIRRSEQDRGRLLDSERAARTEAERANRIKDEFLATISHELRTPLNAILGWTQILIRGEDDLATVREATAVIERNARLQAQLIEDLLDMSRIISGKIRLDIQETNIVAVVEAAIESVQPAANLKGVQINTQMEHGINPIRGDFGRLQQIFWNLLSNAVKFTPRGQTVRVTVSLAGTNVEVRVADTGQGMPPAFIPYVFDRFSQADASMTRRHGGLGLGLAIVKQLVELHGGTVRAESPGEGFGSTFVVQIPVAAVQQAATDGKQPLPALRQPMKGELADLTGLSVLVVDDDADARRLMKRLLTECRAEVKTAASGDEGLSLLQSWTPSVLISDIGMPGMDGYEFIAKVRAERADATRLPAAAVTAFARVEDRRHALHAGYQAHMTKPVEPAQLIAAVAQLATSRRITP